MKAFLHKTGAALLAFLLLFSTLSFSVDMHFCGHSLVDLKLFNKAESCGMSMDDGLMEAMGCCSDVEIAVIGQDDLSVPQADSAPIAQWVFTGHVQPLILLQSLPETKSSDFSFRDYSPPPLIQDLPVRNQAFLI